MYPNKRFAPEVAKLISRPASVAAITPENVPQWMR